ncbi:hypothetical protein BGV71_31695 [Burkholderia ubonensis]|uniref:hypothetical protein n=1 Tax=Burkholderia ubonensis TaxID=101571 RepID=UPI0008FE4509|nr:hypothetical protein [Burkholderia ubonensis]OJA66548.1 hypothetical protein BGV71_31695 [Burkholderia ubonensis]OJA74491.1 hypothetical protein BGV72_24365 [Burkholderia ubonensis]
MNTIAELRSQLFSTLQQLNDERKPMDIERAKVVADVAQVIINSAKVEVEFLRVTKGKGTGFIPDLLPGANPSAGDDTGNASTSPEPQNGIVSITRHVMEG